MFSGDDGYLKVGRQTDCGRLFEFYLVASSCPLTRTVLYAKACPFTQCLQFSRNTKAITSSQHSAHLSFAPENAKSKNMPVYSIDRRLYSCKPQSGSEVYPQ